MVWGAFITDSVWNRYENKIKTLARITKSKGAYPVFVVEPFFPNIYENKDQFSKQMEILHRVAKKENVGLVDPYPVLYKKRDSFIFINDSVHFTIFGNQIMADLFIAVIDQILQKNFKQSFNKFDVKKEVNPL